MLLAQLVSQGLTRKELVGYSAMLAVGIAVFFVVFVMLLFNTLNRRGMSAGKASRLGWALFLIFSEVWGFLVFGYLAGLWAALAFKVVIGFFGVVAIIVLILALASD